MMRVFLIGFMSAGKTTLGRRVAARLGVPFFDLDERIERNVGKSIVEIFEERGEEGFRRLESEALSDLIGCETEGVIATGGGTFTREANRALIEASGLSVWLDVPPARLIARANADAGAGASARRPLFDGPDEALALLRAREDAYARADVRLEVDGETVEDDAERLYILLSERIEVS